MSATALTLCTVFTNTFCTNSPYTTQPLASYSPLFRICSQTDSQSTSWRSKWSFTLPTHSKSSTTSVSWSEKSYSSHLRLTTQTWMDQCYWCPADQSQHMYWRRQLIPAPQIVLESQHAPIVLMYSLKAVQVEACCWALQICYNSWMVSCSAPDSSTRPTANSNSATAQLTKTSLEAQKPGGRQPLKSTLSKA